MNAHGSCTATIFYTHTPAYVALISIQICPIFILMKVYCMCAYNIWCHKNGLCRRTSPRPSHVLAHHPNRQLPLVLRAMHKMENGCLPRLLPSVSGMPNPGERLGFNLVCKKCSPQNYKRGGGQKSGGWVLSKIPPPPQISPFSPVFPPFSPRFPSVFPRFSPFFPVFPRFSPFFPVFPCYREPNADWVREPWTPVCVWSVSQFAGVSVDQMRCNDQIPWQMCSLSCGSTRS